MTPSAKPSAASVLVVEDDPELNTLVGAYVQLCGYAYRRALDGREALEAVASEPPAAVITDIMMPGMSGFDVCDALRARPATARTPIIVLSAMGDDATRERTRNCGADAHLVKPFDPDALMDTLTRLVSSRTASA